MIWKILRNSLFAILAILLFSNGKDEPDIIYWSGEHKLTWGNFEGNPRYDYPDISALTSSGIMHYKGCKDGKIIFKVNAYFEKKESWVKNVARTTHHLAHEQLHFDITELHARKLKKALKERNFRCDQEAEFEQFINYYLENWNNDQHAYDLLSRHSLDTLAQTDWFYRVAMELSLLKDME